MQNCDLKSDSLAVSWRMVLIFALLALMLGAQGVTPVNADTTSTSQIFWLDSANGTLGMAPLPGGSPVTIISLLGVSQPRGLKMDAIHHKLYFQSGTSGNIVRTNFDGSGLETLITASPVFSEQIQGFTLDLVNGYIYYGFKGTQYSIRRADLDGSNSRILTNVTGAASGLTLDRVNSRLYWADTSNNRIMSVYLNGDGMTAIVTAGGDYQIDDLFIDGSTLYFSSYSLGGSPWKLEKVATTGTGRGTVASQPGDALGSLAFDPVHRLIYFATYYDKLGVVSADGYNQDLNTSFITGQNMTEGVALYLGPAATTNAATNVTGVSATLNGTVVAGDYNAAPTFEYGLTSAYGSSLNSTPASVSGSGDTSVSGDLTGLTPGSIYHFRVKAVSDGGVAYGADQNFTTACQSTITVTSADDSGPGTLRQAIADVCSGGTITFDNDYTIILSSTLQITKSLTINGSGHTVTISGDHKVQIISIKSPTTALTNFLTNLTLVNGQSDIENGGAIYVDNSNLFVENCTFSGNNTLYDGGGIYNLNALTSVTNSTFTQNTARQLGGALFNNYYLSISKSSFSGNVANEGGVIYNLNNLTISKSTFSGNVARFTYGGVLFNYSGTVAMYDSLLANSATQNPSQVPVECYRQGGSVDPVKSLIEDGTCGVTLSGDPLLAPLGNYGGPTQTFALLPGSPAINAGSDSIGTDQRGRSCVGLCDIGAFESQGFALSVDSGDAQSANLNSPFGTSLVVGVTANTSMEPVDGGLVSFAAPGSGVSASLTGSPAAISGGAAGVSATANGNSGSYSVTAAATGATSDAIFALTNQTPPTLTTLAAGNITATSATLNATANANGIDSTISFEYGLDTAYGNFVNAAPNLVSGNTDTPVSAAISGLTTYTTYHFRAVANNQGGTVYGADQTFTPQPSDFGDLPESYGTSLSANGPHHSVPSSPVLYLGTTIDTEEDGAPSSGANRDDLTNLDDEDGVSLINPESWLPGVPAQLSVTSSASGFLNVWIDFNQNGIFDGMEHILIDQPISSGLNTPTFMVPVGASATISTGLPARFRVASIPGIVNPTGPAVDGEVEDYIFRNQMLSINDVTLDEGDSGTSTLTFTVSLTTPAPTGGVTFDIATADGTATTADGDYSAKSLTGQSIPAGSSTTTFEVSVHGDTAPEVDETFQVNITNVSNATVTDGQGTGTITNDDTLPTLITNPASGVTSSSATLNGTVNAEGDSTTVTFEYGPTTAYGSSINANPNTVSGATNTAVLTTLNGLAPNTLFHYRVLGTSSKGTSLGDDQTFTTLDFSLVTTIHNGSVHTPIDAAALNDSLHAAVSITGSGPVASGSVSFIAYAYPYCGGSGTPAGILSLDSGGVADPSTSFLLTVDGLSFRAHYNGDSNYPAADGLCTSISTTAYPTVLALSANTHPKDGDTLTTSPTNLIVQFNRDVLHGNSTDADSADNPLNYLLVEAGSNDTFDTSACGGTLGGLQQDDTPVTINAVTYNPATFTAAISYNHGAPLPVGRYLLFICGTTSISDPTRTNYLNNELDDSRVRFDILSSSTLAETVETLPATGFAPDQWTFLPFQPVDKRYKEQGMALEIPTLSVKQAIVGVPGPEWDVSWLGNQIGYLQGTAFPTWNGNSVLTGHVSNANGKPGPFASLGNLAWGEQIIIHAWGQNYIYEVRSVNLWTSPNATEALSQQEELPWLTLITCHGYDEKTNTYRWRTVVRAVLIEVE